MLKKNYIIILCVLILAIGFTVSLSYDMERVIEKSGGITLTGDDFHDGSHDLNARNLGKSDDKISTYTAKMDGDRLMPIGDRTFSLVIPSLKAQAYEVYFNGEFIYSIGDMTDARSSISHFTANISISKDTIRNTNTIAIRIHALDSVGLGRLPIGLTDSATAGRIEENLSFRSQGITMVSLGIYIFGIVVAIMMIILSERRNHGFIYLTAAIVFLAVYSLDFLSISQLGMSYILFRKIVLFSLFASIFFLGLSFSRMFEAIYTCIVSSILFSLAVISVIFIWDAVLLKSIFDIMIPFISITVILWIVVCAIKMKSKDEAVVFLFGFSSMLIFTVADAIAIIVQSGSVIISIFGYAMIFSMILLSLLYIEITRRNLAIEHETRQRSHFYQQAITDPLTGAYNLKHTMSLLALDTPPFTVVMMDIDNFKEINDDFGHPAGDYILKFLVRKMLDEFRDTDIVGRYGGDEFIIILRGCSEKNAFDIMNRFRALIEREKVRFGSDSISMTLSIGLAYCEKTEDMDKVIKGADEALYRAKDSGRNQVSV